LLLAAVAYWAIGCAAAFGPGYTIVNQEIDVRFVPAPGPVIHLAARYHLRNTGNQPLSLLEVRLPGRRRFHTANPQALWDGNSLSFETSPANPRNVLLPLPRPWTVATSHTLQLSVDFQRADPSANSLNFTTDSFFLPAQGWNPELLPARGLFATGGVPPKSWELVVNVPRDFLVHTSGQPNRRKTKTQRDELRIIALHQPKDAYPFVIAGRFKSADQSVEDETIHLWTHSDIDTGALREPSGALVRTIRAYDAMFGRRARDSHELWFVECPVALGCFTLSASNYNSLIFESSEKPSAEMASLDTIMVDLTGGPPVIAAAAPSLASGWLGYDQNPGFFEQVPPLSALPAFAAARGREAVEGARVREEVIRRALRLVPVAGSDRQTETDSAVRAKSFLFFYGLQDRFGRDVFDKAISHMLYARAGRGFDLKDLIAAFEQETHENVAEFVRLWMKHFGVPAEFRSRYEGSSAKIAGSFKETAP
jgi:hypothetical protein